MDFKESKRGRVNDPDLAAQALLSDFPDERKKLSYGQPLHSMHGYHAWPVYINHAPALANRSLYEVEKEAKRAHGELK